jgi:hypothetical protein
VSHSRTSAYWDALLLINDRMAIQLLILNSGGRRINGARYQLLTHLGDARRWPSDNDEVWLRLFRTPRKGVIKALSAREAEGRLALFFGPIVEYFANFVFQADYCTALDAAVWAKKSSFENVAIFIIFCSEAVRRWGRCSFEGPLRYLAVSEVARAYRGCQLGPPAAICFDSDGFTLGTQGRDAYAAIACDVGERQTIRHVDSDGARPSEDLVHLEAPARLHHVSATAQISPIDARHTISLPQLAILLDPAAASFTK